VEIFIMVKKMFCVIACLWLAGCSIVPKNSESTAPPSPISSNFLVTIYPGLGENFNPDPKLTDEELDYLTQLNQSCVIQVGRMHGKLKTMGEHGLTIGALNGIFGAFGANLAFDLSFLDYLTYIGLNAFGAGTANGKITFDQAVQIAEGYCMTGMVGKAAELDGELRRIFIIPMPVGYADLPEVSDEPAPTFSGGNGTTRTPLPPL
jgi:hypothetical protein